MAWFSFATILWLCFLTSQILGHAAVSEGGISPQSTTPAEGTNGVKLSTEHFILYVEKLDAAETGRFAEAAYEQMKKFFQVEPDHKLQVKVFANQQRYQTEIDRLRTVFNLKRRVRDVSGLYYRETACCYLYVRPQEYELHQLLLHEIAHEYHDLIRSWHHVPSLDFCDEGIAEYFALHSWDGQILQVGIVPPISSFDHPRAALRQLHNTLQFDLGSVVAGDTDLDYPLAWGLVSFLIDQHRPQFNIWRQGINNDVEPRVVWQKQFGAVTPEFLKALETWLQSHAPPWQVIKGKWCPWGQSLEGRSLEDESALAILNQTPGTLAFSWDSAQSNTVAGATFGFRGAKSFYVLQRRMDGPWDLEHYLGGFPEKADHQNFQSAGSPPAVSIEPGERMTTLKFDNHALVLTNVVGPVGLWVKSGLAHFQVK
jgi:hypothetical protein